jgi:hypothetical protein
LAHEVFDLLFVQSARDELASSGDDLVIETGATASGAEQETACDRLPNADEDQAALVALERKKEILGGHAAVSSDRGGPVAMTTWRDQRNAKATVAITAITAIAPKPITLRLAIRKMASLYSDNILTLPARQPAAISNPIHNRESSA